MLIFAKRFLNTYIILSRKINPETKFMNIYVKKLNGIFVFFKKYPFNPNKPQHVVS
jgi:hypothetical protein